MTLPLLVILPGLDGAGRYMSSFVEACAGQFDTQVVSLPVTLDAYEPGAIAMLDLLPSTTPYLLVAESFAGPLALHIAQYRPEGLQGVVLSASFTRPPLPRALLLILSLLLPRLYDGVSRAVASMLLANDAHSAKANQAINDFQKLPKRCAMKRLRAIARLNEADEKLGHRCPCPLLILRAGKERLLRSDYGDLAALTRTEKIANAPHMLLSHASAEAVAAIANWARIHTHLNGK